MSDDQIESEYETDYEVGQDNIELFGFDIHNPVFFLSAGLVLVFGITTLCGGAFTTPAAASGAGWWTRPCSRRC